MNIVLLLLLAGVLVAGLTALMLRALPAQIAKPVLARVTARDHRLNRRRKLE